MGAVARELHHDELLIELPQHYAQLALPWLRRELPLVLVLMDGLPRVAAHGPLDGWR